ncbi:MAG TPA: type II toxin-antitoxin system Phd/YefM family antitoxin, partial [Pirellulales bacterium]|nr:type II toxin-antitoxin system Phd/YefM family antitoxin [Pirellulales bacterium]
SVAEVKAKLSAFLKESVAKPVVVTRNGKAVAVLVGVEDDEEVERLLLAHSPRLRAILDAAEGRIDRGEGIPHDEFWRQVETGDRTREKNGSVKKRRTKRQR